VDLLQAAAKGLLSRDEYCELFNRILERLAAAGYDGSLLEGNDMLVAQDPEGKLLCGADGVVEVRVCNFELIRKV
jgi:hypothetical protein